MQRLYLKFPTYKDKEDILRFKEEFVSSGQRMAGVGGLDKMEFDEWFEKIISERNRDTCEEGRVPATLFLSIRREDEKIIGMVQVRHELNDYLLKFGGHIGDCVRPSEQGNGYATEQIGLALNFCKNNNINRVLITCKQDNVASARTIIKNGGVLENEIPNPHEDDVMMQRYWIEL